MKNKKLIAIDKFGREFTLTDINNDIDNLQKQLEELENKNELDFDDEIEIALIKVDLEEIINERDNKFNKGV